MKLLPPTPEAERRVATDDVDLVHRSLAGDQDARAEIVDRLACVPRMVRARNRRMATSMSGHDLEEISQEVLLSVWSKLERYDGTCTIEGWVWGFVVRQHMKAAHRSRTRPLQVEAHEEELAGDPAREPPGDEAQVVRAAVQSLGSPAADVVRLRHFEHLTYAQIAVQLDAPLPTVRTWYYRSLPRLRTLLRSLWPDDRDLGRSGDGTCRA